MESVVEDLSSIFLIAISELEVEIVKNNEKYHSLNECKLLKEKWKQIIDKYEL